MVPVSDEANIQMRPQLFSLYLPALLLFSLCLIVFSPYKAGFLHSMAAGHPQWTPFKLPQALAIMTVGQGKGVVGGEESGTVSFCQKIKSFLGSHRADFPSGHIDKNWVTWMPLAARESGKVGHRAPFGLDVS